MRGIFRKGYREYEFLNSRETRFVEFHDRFDAMEFLRGFIHDHYNGTMFRKLLEREMLGINLSGVGDYGVLERVADLLVAKQIRVVERYDLFETGFHRFAAEHAAEVETPPAEAYTDEPEPEEEPEAEPAPSIAEAQAAALIQAARSGAAICEA